MPSLQLLVQQQSGEWTRCPTEMNSMKHVHMFAGVAEPSAASSSDSQAGEHADIVLALKAQVNGKLALYYGMFRLFVLLMCVYFANRLFTFVVVPLLPSHRSTTWTRLPQTRPGACAYYQ